jgi:hypothetical protein
MFMFRSSLIKVNPAHGVKNKIGTRALFFGLPLLNRQGPQKNAASTNCPLSGLWWRTTQFRTPEEAGGILSCEIRIHVDVKVRSLDSPEADHITETPVGPPRDGPGGTVPHHATFPALDDEVARRDVSVAVRVMAKILDLAQESSDKKATTAALPTRVPNFGK